MTEANLAEPISALCKEGHHLPPEIQQTLDSLCQQIDSSSPQVQKEAHKLVAGVAMTHLHPSDRRDIVQKVMGLPPPKQSTVDKLWVGVIGAFAFIMIASFIALVAGVFMKVEYNLLFTIFTTVTSFLAGLFTSAIRNQQIQ